MPAAKLNLSIEQGATWRYTLLAKQGLSASGPALNLTGYTARMQLRAQLPDVDDLVTLSTANGRITITPLMGRIELLLSADETAELAFEAAVYDLELMSPTGEVTRLVQGRVSLSPEVTR